jgi:hypothetical protein
MSRTSKFDYQAAIEKNLTPWPDGLTLDELLEHSALDVDRSTLFRHLTRLIERGRAERIGKARATRYRLLGAAPVKPEAVLPDAASTAPPAPPQALEDHRPHAAAPATGSAPTSRGKPESTPAVPPADSFGAPDKPPARARPDSAPASPQAPFAFTASAFPSAARSDGAALEDSRHGPLVIKAVRRIVRERKRFNPVNLDIYLSLLVPREELDEFTAAVRKELAGLHADNLHRYGISPAEFSAYTPLEEFSEASPS